MQMTTTSPRAAYEARCLETLDTALGSTPLYEAWRSLDPGPGAPVDRRYVVLPALTKADIRAHFPGGLVPAGLDLAGGLARGEVSYVRTSGTADEALTNIWNQAWWDASERASWALNDVAARVATGTHREAILASALSVGPRANGAPLSRGERSLGRFLFLNEYALTREWPAGHEERILAELADLQPAVLEANPSLLARLARHAERTGAAVYQPALITLTYEFPSRLQLRAIRRVFRSPVASSYGSTEAGYVFMECEQGRLHQNAGFCRVDVEPLAEGAMPAGRLLVTTFANRWFPLLRFEIGDIGRPSAGPCPCGRTLGLTLDAIEGRLVSVCEGEQGRLVTHGAIDEAVARADGVAEYRLRQVSPSEVLVAVVPEPGAGLPAVRACRSALRELFGDGIEVNVEQVKEIAAEASGKFLLARREYPLGTDRLLAGREAIHA
jgi:phenylacetate-coenzyme A ligase PaaK-like adenylate-forming protein